VSVIKVNFSKLRVFTAVAAVIAAIGIQSVTPVIVAGQTQTATSKIQTKDKSVIHVKFSDEADVALQNDTLVSQTGVDLSQANLLLHTKGNVKDRVFNRESREEINQRRQHIKATTGRVVRDLNGYYAVKVRSGVDGDQLVSELKALPYVTEAYFVPISAPTPTTPSYSTMQSYRLTAPTGMDIDEAASVPGVKGENVQVTDVEYSWNLSHEDIAPTVNATTRLVNGTPVDPFNDDNHGTAVAGIIHGAINNVGVNGIAPNAALHVANVNNVERGWDLANTIYSAQSAMQPGDVMLLEQQAWGPDNTLAPAEWVPEVYDAITYATARGIIVIEAAGNGGQNLDDPKYGTTFPNGKPDSGAIMVGAGAACGLQANRSRMSFSNYGRRVNVQGWGECVTTTGYGNLGDNTLKNAWYTNTFNGTSSASALIAAVSASVSSAKEAQTGQPLTPAALRSLLVSTGTPQDLSVGGNIGPLPNVAKALGVGVDKTAPSTPTSLTVSSSSSKAYLKWKASSDNVKVSGYQIYRNNFLIATTSSLSYTDSNVRVGTKYSYKVRAIDTSHNVSGYSSTIYVTIRR
jgi:serine protease